MPLYINYPSWIHPQIFPNIPFLGLLRWYGLMYVFAFVTAYLVFQKQVNEGALNTKTYTVTDDDVFGFFATGILMLLLGARLASCLIYDDTLFYLKKPWLIFWPFDGNGNFTGLQGMSYHGGVVGGFLGMAIWCRKNKQPLLKWIDAMGISIPLGYTFGRLGNFLNGELFGRITTQPWGMIFPSAQKFSSSITWVADFAQQAGVEVTGGLINLPRHPSQLYEALFEGVFLFLIFWNLRKKKPFDGFFTGLYFVGYGVVRFIIEYFREPDANMGYIIHKTDAPTYLNDSLLNISTGQILCFIMIVTGATCLIGHAIWNKKNK